MKATFALAMLLGALGCGGGEEENKPPEILPVMNPIDFNNFAADPVEDDPCGGLRPCEFDLQIMNGGNQTLEISGLEINGDVRCAIQGLPYFETGGQTATIEGHDQLFLHIDYLPGGATPSPVGVDQIEMIISSNASDYPELRISICGFVNEGEWSPEPDRDCNLEEVPAEDCPNPQ